MKVKITSNVALFVLIGFGLISASHSVFRWLVRREVSKSRLAAIAKSDDQKELYELALADKDSVVRMAALKRINDLAYLLQLVDKGLPEVQELASSKLLETPEGFMLMVARPLPAPKPNDVPVIMDRDWLPGRTKMTPISGDGLCWICRRNKKMGDGFVHRGKNRNLCQSCQSDLYSKKAPERPSQLIDLRNILTPEDLARISAEQSAIKDKRASPSRIGIKQATAQQNSPPVVQLIRPASACQSALPKAPSAAPVTAPEISPGIQGHEGDIEDIF